MIKKILNSLITAIETVKCHNNTIHSKDTDVLQVVIYSYHVEGKAKSGPIRAQFFYAYSGALLVDRMNKPEIVFLICCPCSRTFLEQIKAFQIIS